MKDRFLALGLLLLALPVFSQDWQRPLGLTHDPDVDSVWARPVRFYLDDPKCPKAAKDFYYGAFRPADDEKTSELLALVYTGNARLRPFFRWILDATIRTQDGALAELTGLPARRYAEKFPNEFFDFIERADGHYDDWADAIAYSGFYEGDDFNDTKGVHDRFLSAMNRNCYHCTAELKRRIRELAMDCFPG